LEKKQGLPKGEETFFGHQGDLGFHLRGNAGELASQLSVDEIQLTFLTAFLTELLGERHGGVLQFGLMNVFHFVYERPLSTLSGLKM
jgi:hypothetical protein